MTKILTTDGFDYFLSPLLRFGSVHITYRDNLSAIKKPARRRVFISAFFIPTILEAIKYLCPLFPSHFSFPTSINDSFLEFPERKSSLYCKDIFLKELEFPHWKLPTL